MADDSIFVGRRRYAANLITERLFNTQKFTFSISARQQFIGRLKDVPKGFIIDPIRHLFFPYQTEAIPDM